MALTDTAIKNANAAEKPRKLFDGGGLYLLVIPSIRLRAVADRGYYSGPQIKECADVGIAVMLPKPTTAGAKHHGRFGKTDFIYIARDDEYQCPAGERAIYGFVAVKIAAKR